MTTKDENELAAAAGVATIAPPIRLRKLDESFAITDGSDRSLAYVYFDDEPARRNAAKRISRAEADEVAKTIAAALREKYGSNGG